MSRIRGRGNRDTELRLAMLLRGAAITGWRRHLPLPGKPDFAFVAQKLALFVDGCFWHGCPRCYQAPRQNAAFWREKIARNRTRDRHVTRMLRSAGWAVLRVWECRLANAPDSVVARLRRAKDSRERTPSRSNQERAGV